MKRVGKILILLFLVVVAFSYAGVALAGRSDSYLIVSHGYTSMGGEFAWKEIRNLKNEIDQPFLWVRKGNHEWVISDYGTIQRAIDVFEPVERFVEHEEHELELREDELDELEDRLDDEEERLEDLEEEIEDEVEEKERWTAELRER